MRFWSYWRKARPNLQAKVLHIDQCKNFFIASGRYGKRNFLPQPNVGRIFLSSLRYKNRIDSFAPAHRIRFQHPMLSNIRKSLVRQRLPKLRIIGQQLESTLPLIRTGGYQQPIFFIYYRINIAPCRAINSRNFIQRIIQEFQIRLTIIEVRLNQRGNCKIPFNFALHPLHEFWILNLICGNLKNANRQIIKDSSHQGLVSNADNLHSNRVFSCVENSPQRLCNH
ncbi:hypothetical protein D9M72_410060 [compost metagenome]